MRYIHLNPLRARSVKTLAQLDRYRWCGHSVLMDKIENEWQDRGYVLKWFGQKQGEAKKAYHNYVQKGINEGRRPELVGGGLIRSLGGWSAVKAMRRSENHELSDDQILGRSEFVEWVIKEAETKIKYQLPVKEHHRIIDEYISKLCKNENVSVEELKSVFRNVYSCLLDEGLFVFDMNLEPGFLTQWQGYFGIVEDDHVCLFPQSYDPEKRIARFDATILRLTDYWYRSDVTLLEKCYSVEEIEDTLSETGFLIMDTFDYSLEFGRQDLTTNSGRIFFLCEKPGE